MYADCDCRARTELTGVISDVGIGSQPGDVICVYHVGVPLFAVAGVMEDVIQRLCRHILTHYPHLKHTQRNKLHSLRPAELSAELHGLHARRIISRLDNTESDTDRLVPAH